MRNVPKSQSQEIVERVHTSIRDNTNKLLSCRLGISHLWDHSSANYISNPRHVWTNCCKLNDTLKDGDFLEGNQNQFHEPFIANCYSKSRTKKIGSCINGTHYTLRQILVVLLPFFLVSVVCNYLQYQYDRCDWCVVYENDGRMTALMAYDLNITELFSI